MKKEGAALLFLCHENSVFSLRMPINKIRTLIWCPEAKGFAPNNNQPKEGAIL